MLLDRRHPRFGSYDSVISIDEIGMKSWVDGFFNPTYVPVRVITNKVNLLPNRNMSCFINVFRNCWILSAS